MDDETKRELEQLTGKQITAPKRPGRGWPGRFLVNLTRCDGVVKYAAALTGIHERTVWRHIAADPGFAEKVKAQQLLVDHGKAEKLEHTLYERALNGTTEPIYQGGQLVGARRVYDNKLGIRILETLNPDRWAPSGEFGGGHDGQIIRFTFKLGDSDRDLTPIEDAEIEGELTAPDEEDTPHELNP